ncbi:MAG: hypothetical protein JW929_10085 [Anaerolineales bacterium]|nr:hypothetical protein [Anaerolineales bacterium]
MRMRSRGAAMALYAAFIGLVGVPLLAATVDVTRVWLKKAELSNALEAACSAYANTPDLAAFKNRGALELGSEARAEGYRFFGYNISEGGQLTEMTYFPGPQDNGVYIARCSGRISVRPIIFAGIASFDLVKTVTVKVKFASSW